MRLALLCCVLSIAVVVVACGGGEVRRTPTPGARELVRPGAVPTATPWPSPPAPIFVEGSPGPTPTAAAGQTTYTVQAGDSPSSIAERYGVDVQELMRANNITDPTKLAVGQRLVIPGAQARPTPSPRPGATTPTPQPGAATPTPRPTPSPQPGTATPSPRPGAATPTPAPAGQPGQCSDPYVVQPGDYPGLIAEKCGVSLDELLRLNNITDPAGLQVGQQLRLPRR